MKTRRHLNAALLLAALLALFLTGCSTPQGQYSNRKVNVLGGLMTTEAGAYDRSGPLTIGTKSSEVDPAANLDGGKTTFLWGLFTFTDE